MSQNWNPEGSTRKITAKEQGNRGCFPSEKVIDGIAEYESDLERDLLLECHHAPDVLTFQHQPVTIAYTTIDGSARKYTPDVFIEFMGGTSALIEVKYDDEVKTKEGYYKERWEAARKWAAKRNIIFAVLTEFQIRTPRWFNIWFTLGASKCIINGILMPKLKAIIPSNGEKYSFLCSILAETEGISMNKAAQVICYAIYHGLVFVDNFSINQISNKTIIRNKRLSSSPAFKPLKQELGLENDSNLPINLQNPQAQIHEISLNSSKIFSFAVPIKYEKTVEKRQDIVILWLKRPKSKRTAEWRANFCNKWNIGERTIYTWVKAYQTEGIEGLIPKHSKRGRQSILSKDLVEIIEDARQFYFKPLKTLNQAYEYLEEKCSKSNIISPNEATFRTYIYRNSTASDFARKRGKKYYKSNFTASLASFQSAYMPMQILQFDNTRFDVFPVDSDNRERLSTPYMTAAIDCYSRMITGFDISFFPSSSRSVLDVLAQSILPKTKTVDTYETESNWPIQGFPALILVDNGMDYRSKALKDFCMKYDIILEFAPIRTPRYKAFIEQWFNILHNALVGEAVSGCRPLLKQRLENPDLRPEAEAVMTLQEIEIWTHKWVLDEYHLSNQYDEHVPAPYLRWEKYQAAQTDVILPLPRECPQDQKEIDMMNLSKHQKIVRILGYHGVIWEHLTYNNKPLSKYYKKYGKLQVSVLIDQRDIRTAWVLIPEEINPIMVELASGWAQAIAKIYGDSPIHASAWIKDVKLIKTKLKSKLSPYVYQKEISRIKRKELLKKAKKTSKTALREKEKMRETMRKSKSQKSNSSTEEQKKNHSKSSKPKYKAEDIDWDNLPTLWTDDFYSGD